MVKFYICKHCGNIITKIYDSGVSVVCCGEAMQELFAITVDASHEKHLPVVEQNDDFVNIKIGSVEHPMTEEHHIDWIVLVSEKGFQIKYLEKLDDPYATFKTDEKILAVYAYCNLHGLWMKEL